MRVWADDPSALTARRVPREAGEEGRLPPGVEPPRLDAGSVKGGRPEADTRRMAEPCRRCGFPLSGAERGLPCHVCWEARADAAMVRLLVDHVEEDERGALWHLGQIEDPAAAPALRDANTHSDSRIRAAATLSLGWSGSGEDVPLAAAALVDDDAAIRRAARRTLAELGGQRAADALAISLDDSGADELAETVLALAWLRDRRALQRARRLAHEQLGEENYSLSPWTLPWALVRLGHNHDRVALTDATLQLARSTSIHPQSPGLLRARTALDQLHKALTAELPDEAQRLHEDLYDEDSERAAWVIGRRRPTLEPAAPALDPPRPDRVPRLALAKQLDPSPGGPAWPAPKFGGQPDWVDEPAWPLGHGGFPLVFYGQLPVLGEPERIAYIFVSLDPDALSNEPLGEGNAVVLRPGSPCRLPTASLASGPSLYEPVHDPNRFRPPRKARPYERFARLEEGADPPEWSRFSDSPAGADHGDWNKIGGTPLFLQGPEYPAGAGWRFAFQFSAGWAGAELGDGADCYGFVHEDGSGALLWQCH